MYIVYVFIIVIYTIFIMCGSVTQSIFTNMYVLVHFFNLVLSFKFYVLSSKKKLVKNFLKK